jgi:hypothetical protein
MIKMSKMVLCVVTSWGVVGGYRRSEEHTASLS